MAIGQELSSIDFQSMIGGPLTAVISPFKVTIHSVFLREAI